MPPVHPALVHFPIALVVFSFVADLLARFFPKSSLRAAAQWSLAGAVIGGGEERGVARDNVGSIIERNEKRGSPPNGGSEDGIGF